MKTAILTLLVFATSLLAQVTDAPLRSGQGRKVLQLNWLVGDWERQQKNSVLVERWHMVDDTLMEGESVTIKGTDTTVSETMKMLARDSSIYFVAEVPHNDSAIFFRLVDVDSLGWRFENPKHDFPTVVCYKQVSADSMYARIQGIVNGETTGIDFRFRRVESK